jgi:hypothetical protein
VAEPVRAPKKDGNSGYKPSVVQKLPKPEAPETAPPKSAPPKNEDEDVMQ